MPARPNVLVVVLDSVRARNTSLHGHGHRTTPFLEELADEGVTYRHAYAPSTTSISSHASLFTGFHEDEHRLYGLDRRIDEQASVWTGLRDSHGYATGLFTVNPQFRKPVGLRNGFERQVLEADDTKDLPFPDAPDPAELRAPDWFPLAERYYQAVASLGGRRPLRAFANGVARTGGMGRPASAYIIDSFADWSRSVDGQWAAFLNLMDAHTSYRPEPEHNRWADDDLFGVQATAGGGDYAELMDRVAAGSWWHSSALEHLYDGAVHQADAMVRRVVDLLRDRGEFEETLLVVTSDHGEAFGEVSRVHADHHLFAHTVGVHEVQTHVPLVVSPPHGAEGAVVNGLATLTCLPAAVEATVADRFDPDSLLGRDGRVLVSRGDTGTRYRVDDAYAAGAREALPDRTYAGYERVDGRVLKYCRSGSDAATVRVFDAQESAKVDDDEPGVVEWFPGERSDGGLETGVDGTLSDEARERLEGFGYLG